MAAFKNTLSKGYVWAVISQIEVPLPQTTAKQEPK